MTLVTAKEHPHLVKRIVILFNGEDVTKNCDAFDVHEGVVRLFNLNERGHKKAEYVCSFCDVVVQLSEIVTSTSPRCSSCHRFMTLRASKSFHRGAVEVLPVKPEEESMGITVQAAPRTPRAQSTPAGQGIGSLEQTVSLLQALLSDHFAQGRRVTMAARRKRVTLADGKVGKGALTIIIRAERS